MSPRTRAQEIPEVSFEVRRITPDEASQLLEANDVNRNLRAKVVSAYRRDMDEGRWRFTGETIQFSRTGRLLNGQHRLTALAGSTRTEGCTFAVVSGLPDEAQTLMDQGASRGVADALRIAHGPVKNMSIVAAVSRWVVAHPDPGVPNMLSNLKRKVSTAEAVEAFEKNPDIAQAAERAVYLRNYLPASASGIAYAWLYLNRADPSDCYEYFSSMVDMTFGVNPTKDPRRAALIRLRQMTGDSETRGDKATSVAAISVLTRAWNAWRRGEEMTTIMARNSKRQPIDPVRPI